MSSYPNLQQLSKRKNSICIQSLKNLGIYSIGCEQLFQCSAAIQTQKVDLHIVFWKFGNLSNRILVATEQLFEIRINTPPLNILSVHQYAYNINQQSSVVKHVVIRFSLISYYFLHSFQRNQRLAVMNFEQLFKIGLKMALSNDSFHSKPKMRENEKISL